MEMGCNRKKFGVPGQILRQIVPINGATYCTKSLVKDIRHTMSYTHSKLQQDLNNGLAIRLKDLRA